MPGFICEICVGLGSLPRPRSLPRKVAFPSWVVQGIVRGKGRDVRGRGDQITRSDGAGFSGSGCKIECLHVDESSKNWCPAEGRCGTAVEA